ncbi:MAG TPA: YibE/F family protein [Candidatus Paceibacterota bacterium]|nr:YibE/F family protein [Candidatus Paceibacterota bacterium]
MKATNKRVCIWGTLLLCAFFVCGNAAPLAHAQDSGDASQGDQTQVTSDGLNDVVTYIKAQVLSVGSTTVKEIPGTDTSSPYQTIKAKLLEGSGIGQVIQVDNDYLMMKPGDVFYFRHTVNTGEGIDFYSVSDPYRLPVLEFLIGLFVVFLFIIGGKQGMRGLLALIASFFFIGYLLLPGILHGYSPILVSVGVSSLIIILGSYITHGFNRATTAAVVGMIATIIITGLLSYFSIHGAHLSGFTSEEATYLNFDTRGSIDFVGLLLGSMMIGLLGVLYDAAISQAVAVEELFAMGADDEKRAHPRHVFARAMRIGREHIGALVNTLAITYVGTSLPLILLFEESNLNFWVTVNQEVFATEIVRMMIGSIGLILAVPITTLVAVYMLSNNKNPRRKSGEGHTHGHSHMH